MFDFLTWTPAPPGSILYSIINVHRYLLKPVYHMLKIQHSGINRFIRRVKLSLFVIVFQKIKNWENVKNPTAEVLYIVFQKIKNPTNECIHFSC